MILITIIINIIIWYNEFMKTHLLLANMNALPNKQSDLLMQQPKHINVNVKPHNVARALVVLIDREELSFY